MSYTLDFVYEPGGAVRLSLDSDGIGHIEGRTTIPLPEHYKQYAESALADGRKPVGDGKYGNIPLTLSFAITADSIANLDAKARALIAEVTRDNWLKFTPEGGASPLYYRTYHYDKGDPGTLQKRLWRLSKLAWGFTIQLEAELPVGEEQTITVVENLVPNGDFSDYTGSDFTGWVESVTGSATVTPASSYHWLSENTGVRLYCPNAGETAAVMSEDFIPVDNSEYYYLIFNYRSAEFGTLMWEVIQYDASGNDLGDTLWGTDAVAFWESARISIAPAGTGGTDFHANCAKIKIRITGRGIGGTITHPADWYVDAVAFVKADRLTDHILANPLGFTISDALGDVPAPCDFYIEKFWTEAKSITALYLGGRKTYNSGYVPILDQEPSLGAGALDANAYDGSMRQLTVGAELISNNGFNTISGTAGSNTETWPGWTASRGGSAYMIAATDKRREGAYSVKSYLPAMAAAATNTLTSGYIAVTAANDHYSSIWYMLRQRSGLGRFKVEVECYNAVPTLLGTLTLINTKPPRGVFTPAYLDIDSADFPAGTTQIKFKVSTTVGWGSVGSSWDKRSDIIWFDFCSLKEGPPVFFGGDDISFFSGRVRPFWHYKITSAQADKSISLQGRMYDFTDEYTPWLEISNPELDMPDVWRFQEIAAPFVLPNFDYPTDQDLPAMNQELQIKVDSALTATSIYSDCIALIPTDNGYAEIGADDSEHLIIDSRSDFPAFLKSFNGLKNQALLMDQGKVSRPFKLDPNGSNFACLMVWTDEDGNQPAQFYANLSIKYRPRYLVVV